ncbi:uncharacterized protein ETH isoform X2 [Chelonus insularis]|uniref:uncharacterized protein ETH isoform X2 n=1 Tax=Chelonus insularis TaxID=460826 RepID=UPI00158C5F77|nr:uncharacterized protein LOC118068366 isoform X2 [Chelonus insularis]
MEKMSLHKKHQFFIVVYVIVLATKWTTVDADEVPAFFLKIAKNIPRVGRSGRSEDFFLKPSRNIPRVTRGDENFSTNDLIMSYANERNNQELNKRMINYPAPGNLDSMSWEHFPLAIEGPPELWRTLASYANDKYGPSSDDIDNEVWQRNKRKNDNKPS